MSSKINFCPPKRSPLRTYEGSFIGPDHSLQEVESGEQIGGGFGCCGCTGASASYIDHVMWFTEGTTHSPRIKKKRYWKVHLEKKEEIVECILSKT